MIQRTNESLDRVVADAIALVERRRPSRLFWSEKENRPARLRAGQVLSLSHNAGNPRSPLDPQVSVCENPHTHKLRIDFTSAKMPWLQISIREA